MCRPTVGGMRSFNCAGWSYFDDKLFFLSFMLLNMLHTFHSLLFSQWFFLPFYFLVLAILFEFLCYVVFIFSRNERAWLCKIYLPIMRGDVLVKQRDLKMILKYWAGTGFLYSQFLSRFLRYRVCKEIKN